MYSRNTTYRVPPTYSGTAFGKNTAKDMQRDAVGRPSVLSNNTGAQKEHMPQKIAVPDIDLRKNKLRDSAIEEPEHTEDIPAIQQEKKKPDSYGDELLIAALILLIMSKGNDGDSLTVIMLIFLLLS